ncbi:DUF1189 domain-containing protein [Bacillus spongiae]|uniref:DUF1189 domain-containing protein n=2 Tax=Bacillus spongiae TaxID=2683610 RepID=A0ABU8H953_9BACI
MNIFSQLVKSLYSPLDIARFRFQGIGKTILFLFFLTLITTIPTFITLTSFINQTIDEGKNILSDDIPPFEIRNDELQTDLTEPYTKSGNDFSIVIDNSSNSFNPEYDNTFTIAFLQTKMLIATAGNHQEIPYNQLSGLSISDQSLAEYLEMFESSLIIFLPIIYLITYIFSSFMTFMKVILFSFVGVLIAKALQRKLNYRQSFRITAYAITLPTLFFSIMNLLNTIVPGGLLLNSLVTTVMLYLTIKEIPQPKTP